ncbi:hypothetical protein BU24DRAFT_282448 [Aaosphaeria arxii CBS 175.79]|uniref:Uncharacterized protein n=1 Tax=Aaosphaeria arxii CBS 175.79 TaxID=1450172 RepID=A0A6A5XEJ6_9PLEO|nr:uncharacterized protein BU24DRAFT_282448 [Aaosphaeria arxii CBS 175.79]KAF2011492.1 hypothetical protein BU24DRAFT_282448 [Aaosphaeria arxii CBS 175.79]
MVLPSMSHPLEWVQSTKSDPSRISFLDLPREIRDEIYQHAYCVLGDIFMFTEDPFKVRPVVKAKVVWNKSSDGEAHDPISIGKVIPVSLLRVCRQLHAESSEVLFGYNTFRLYSSHVGFGPRYQHLVRNIVFSTDSMIQKIFENDLESVGYWWRRYFWKDIYSKSERLLEAFPNLEKLTFPIKSNRHGQSWIPVFMAAGQRTREYRVNIAALWLKSKCPIDNDRLRDCLHMEITHNGIQKSMYAGSRFALFTLEDEEWDHTEFAEAFEKMKFL